MFSIIPILHFVFVYLLILKSRCCLRREAFLCASIIWAMTVVVMTEILNLFHGINLSCLITLWFISTAVVFVLCFKNIPTITFQDFYSWPELSKIEKWMVSFIILVVILVGLTAFMAPPNSWDALNYHMSRVMFWKQNHSVDHYPTAEFRQLFFQPWTGYAILHFQILSNSDRFATLISWFSYAGSILGVSFISFLLGASRRTQLLASLFAATIPTAIVEASGVRIDSVMAFWLVCLTSLLLLLERDKKFFYVFMFGLALGIAALTKGTAFLIMPPFFIWFSVILFRKFELTKAFYGLILVLVTAFVINAGFFCRNYQLSGDPLGPPIMRQWGLTYDMTPGLLASNVLKTVMYQMGNDWPSWNNFIVKGVKWVHEKANVNIIDDRSTIAATPFDVSVSTHEDGVTNFVQMTLILISFVVIFMGIGKSKDRRALFLAIGLMISFSILVTKIRWTNHITRYNLPIFVLSSVLVAGLFEKFNEKRNWAIYGLIFILMATAIPYLFKNNLRRMIASKKQTVFNTPRVEQYFRNDRSFYEPYVSAINEIADLNCHDIGIYMDFNHWDYPLWVIAEQKLSRPFRMEHVKINQMVPEQYPLGSFSPCAIISVHYVSHPQELQFGQDNIYRKIKDFGRTAVFVPDGFKHNFVPEKFKVLGGN